jgi:PAS domain S-box-containing protein
MINAISLRKIFKASALPTVVLLPDAPRFTIAEVNDPILKNTFIKEEDLIGKGLFEAFPENPNEQFSNSVPNLSKSLQKVIETKQPDKMGIQKYDVALKGNGEYEERYWQVENIPVLSDRNEVQYILHTTIDVTDSVLLEKKKDAQSSLSDEAFRTLIQEGSDLIGIVDENANYKYVSPSFESVLGYVAEDFIGKNGLDLIHPDDRDLVFAEFSKLDKQKRVTIPPCRFRDKNGDWHWIETVATNLTNDPKIGGIVAVSRDITEWVNAEEEVRLSEEKYKLLFHSSPIPKWVYSLDTFKFLDVSETAIKNYGYTKEEFLNMTIKDIRPKEEIEELLEARKSITDRNGIIHFGMFTHCKKDGTKIKVEVSGHKFSFQGKDCMMIAAIDVTERENALRLLNDNQEKLLAAQNIAKIGYFKVDLINHNMFWSDKLYEIWGVDKGNFKITYQNFFKTIHPDDAQKFEEARSNAISNGTAMDLEFRVIQPDGSIKWVHEKGGTSKDEKGNLATFEGTVQDVTESKLLKLSLEESNQRYKYVTQATFDAIWDWDLVTDECFWGEGFQTTFGYDAKTLRSDKSFWTKHAHPEDLDRVSEEIERAVNSKKSNWLIEYRFQKADNSYVDVLDRCIIIRDKNDKAIRMVGAMQDISEKKTLLQLLDKANRLARIGSWEIDVESGSVYWSDITKEIRETGPDFKPTLQIGISRFKEGYSRDTIIKRVKESIKNGRPWEEDLQIYTEKGNLKWIRTIGKAEIVNGKCVKVFGSFQDIDEQKRAEIDIHKLFQEKNTILESIGDAFFAVDKSWIVTYWNNHAESMLQIPKKKILGNYLWDVFSESVDSFSYKKYHEALQTNKKVVFEDYFPPLDKWFEISAYPSENGLSVYFKDITERKISQMQLNELHANLEKTANDLAVSNHELEQFAYIASHDLQEPLRMISSFLTQLEKKYSDVIDAKGKQYIYFAVDGAKRMRQIILDLLEFSRVGRFEGELQEVNTNDVVEEIISLSKKQIEETGATIHFENLPVVKSHKSPLRQVIQNLVSNALKYQQPGKPPVIHISAKEFPAYWQFSVQDNGIGIKPEYFDRIFVIFQRLHNKDEYSGTGMGLAIVKKIVEAMGGNIWIESKEGEGSIFFFTIKR